MKIFPHPARYHQNERDDPKIFFVPYKTPCTKKSGMPVQVLEIWTGPFVKQGQHMPSSSKHWMNKKNFYGKEHIDYINLITHRKIRTQRKYVLLSIEEHVQWIEARQTNRYRIMGSKVSLPEPSSPSIR